MDKATVEKAIELLQRNLSTNGAISTVQFKRALESDLGITDMQQINDIVALLQYPDKETVDFISKKGMQFHHHGRSFVNKKTLDDVVRQTEVAADAKANEVGAIVIADEERPADRQKNRQEEARLGVYVKETLKELYASDSMENECEYVFDVHSERPGAGFENVDLIAVHWRSENMVDLIAVEVKLQFKAEAVHQACNYLRFAHRAWVAITVRGDVTEAAMELRSQNSGLFEYAISQGIGILACRMQQGRSYQVVPIHWPKRHNPEPLEIEQFIERYRTFFESAHVIEPRKKRTAHF